MATITEEEKRARIADFKKSPKQVQLAATFAFVLSIASFLRILAYSYVQGAVLKGVIFGVLLSSWFLLAGSSIPFRKPWGVASLVVLTLFPFFGLFTLSIHLLRLTLEGNLAVSWSQTVLCVSAFIQLAVSCFLLRYLLAKEVRRYVWQPAA